jgi:hypothetical protein
MLNEFEKKSFIFLQFFQKMKKKKNILYKEFNNSEGYHLKKQTHTLYVFNIESI